MTVRLIASTSFPLFDLEEDVRKLLLNDKDDTHKRLCGEEETAISVLSLSERTDRFYDYVIEKILPRLIAFECFRSSLSTISFYDKIKREVCDQDFVEALIARAFGVCNSQYSCVSRQQEYAFTDFDVDGNIILNLFADRMDDFRLNLLKSGIGCAYLGSEEGVGRKRFWVNKKDIDKILDIAFKVEKSKKI